MNQELKTKLKELRAAIASDVHPKWVLDELNKCIALAAQPPKALTDEDLTRMVDERLPEKYEPFERLERSFARNGGYTMLHYARDNGYLARQQPQPLALANEQK